MRAFVDAILTFIGTTSLTDDEFGTLGDAEPDYSTFTYSAILAVVDSREAVSTTRDRLAHYFEAAGTAVTPKATGKSNIFLGGVCS